MDQLCDEVARAQCARSVKCGLYATLELCEADLAYVLSQDGCGVQAMAAVKDGRQAYHPDLARNCIDAMIAQDSCTSTEIPSQCDAVFDGLVQTSGACFDTADCAGDNFCTSNTCPGTCQPTKGVGEVINDTQTESCREGLYMYPGAGTSYTCLERVAGGASCAPRSGGSEPQTCVDGFFCESGTQLCTAKKQAGAACTPDSWEECAADLDCIESVCTGQPEAADLDETCSFVDEILCKGGLFCDVASFTGAGTCELRRPAGGACLLDFACDNGLMCDGADLSATPPVPGTCRPPRGLGETCTSHSECISDAWCNVTCVARRPVGQSCVESEECMNGYCANAKCVALSCEDPTP